MLNNILQLMWGVSQRLKKNGWFPNWMGGFVTEWVVFQLPEKIGRFLNCRPIIRLLQGMLRICIAPKLRLSSTRVDLVPVNCKTFIYLFIIYLLSFRNEDDVRCLSWRSNRSRHRCLLCCVIVRSWQRRSTLVQWVEPWVQIVCTSLLCVCERKRTRGNWK